MTDADADDRDWTVTDQLADLDALRRRAEETTTAIGARTVDLVTTSRRQAGLVWGGRRGPFWAVFELCCGAIYVVKNVCVQ